MKLVTCEEKLDLEKFLEPHLKAIWEHKNSERSEDDKIDAFQFGFNLLDIFHYRVDDDIEFYMAFSSSLYKFVQDTLVRIADERPDLFGTGNARDVIKALYEATRQVYNGDERDYEKYLRDWMNCYVVYKVNGVWSEDILRLELFSIIQENKEEPGKYDFTGGLMHVLKHFSVEGRCVSVGAERFDLFDIHHLVYLIAMAFRLRQGEGKKYKAVQELTEGNMTAAFYREPNIGMFFLNSYYLDRRNK